MKRTLSVLLPLIIILALILGALTYLKSKTSHDNHNDLSGKNQPLDVTAGLLIPDFKVNLYTGVDTPVETHSYEQLKKKVTLINFWASWCDGCMEEMPSMVKLFDTYQSQGFTVLSINVDENPFKVIPEIKEKFKIKFPIGIDTNNLLSDLFAVNSIPLTLLVDSQNKVMAVYSGEIDWMSAELKTTDVNSQATVENGQLTRIWGREVVVSPNMHRANQDATYGLKANTAGKVDLDTASNNVTGSILAVRWDQWRFGYKRMMNFEIQREPQADATTIVVNMRVGLINRDNEASAISYGVTLS
jgi:thiol-disulfide isomerase/thioredoxin